MFSPTIIEKICLTDEANKKRAVVVFRAYTYKNEKEIMESEGWYWQKEHTLPNFTIDYILYDEFGEKIGERLQGEMLL